MGKKVQQTVDISKLSKYNTIEEAIEHIRRSEAKQRINRRKERKNDRDDSSC